MGTVFFAGMVLLLGEALSTPVALQFPDGTTPISQTLRTYVSYNIDSSCNRGFHHINFTNPNLHLAAKALSPSKLRFGGSGNDNLFYSMDPKSTACQGIPPSPLPGECGYFTDGCLNTTHWDNLYGFSEAAQAEFIFGIAFNLAEACKHGAAYAWDPSNAKTLLRHLASKNQTVFGFELGNEIDNLDNPNNHCNVTALQQAAALGTFGDVLYNDFKANANLIGPDTGGFKPQEWLTAYLPAAMKAGLHSVTHHVYPGLSRETFDTPEGLDSSNDEIAWYVATVQKYAPTAEIWAGEDGPKGGGNDGTCGGNTSICGLYASALWFADDLGNRAKAGFVQYQRQDFFGAAYGLTGSVYGGLARSELGVNEPLFLRPDYWIQFLWKRTVGLNVLNVTSNNANLRTYGFSGPPPSSFAAGECGAGEGGEGGEGGYTLILINLQRSSDVTVQFPSAVGRSTYSAWVVSPPNNDPFSPNVLLNNKPLPQVVDVNNGKSDFLSNIPGTAVSASIQKGIVVPASSIAFVCVQPIDLKMPLSNSNFNSNSKEASLQINKKIGQTNPNYASFNIDSSFNRGFFHMNFSNPNLRAAAKSLAPSTVRFGGTGNDYLHYDCETIPGQDNDLYGCLNDTHRADLLGLASTSGNDFLWGLSFDMCQACAVNDSSYVWSPKDAIFLMSKMKTAKQSVWGFELGNEVNNREKGGNDDCNLLPKQQSQAILDLGNVLREQFPIASERPKQVGPDTGYHDAPNWLNQTLSNVAESSTPNLLHAVTHHVYPGIKRNNYNDPERLNQILAGDVKWYGPIVEKFAPNAQLWAGEDGPAGGGESGTCSGTAGDPHNISACGLYATTLWYADEMALRAAHGFKQYQRQDLVGGRYSLVGTLHDNEYEPVKSSVVLHPDFWVTFLWKRIVGSSVLNATLSMSTPKTVRAYAHCGKPPSAFHVSGWENGAKTAGTLILINLDNATSTTSLNVNEITDYNMWTLTSGVDSVNPFGTKVYLNGKQLESIVSNGQPIGNVPVAGVKGEGGNISLPPLSVSFVVVKGIDANILEQCI